MLDVALAIIHEEGIDGLTFSSLSTRCGLAAPTLVQRFSNKAALIQRTLLHAWDQLEARTRQLAASSALSPDGAIELLLGLSGQYEGVDDFGAGLLLLREDVRDGALRARGVAWEAQLVGALDDRLASSHAGEGWGYALAAYWQGAVILWAYQADPPLPEYLADKLRAFIELTSPPAGG